MNYVVTISWIDMGLLAFLIFNLVLLVNGLLGNARVRTENVQERLKTAERKLNAYFWAGMVKDVKCEAERLAEESAKAERTAPCQDRDELLQELAWKSLALRQRLEDLKR